MKRFSDELLIDVYMKVRELENIVKEFIKLLEEELMERNLLFEALNSLDNENGK